MNLVVNRGFVALGTSDEDVPEFEAQFLTEEEVESVSAQELLQK